MTAIGVVLNALLVKLRDPVTGINPNLILAASEYGISSFQIDVSSGSPAIVQGDFDMNALFRMEDMTFPAIALYPVTVQNTNYLNFHRFSGTVIFGINAYFSWSADVANTDFVSIPSAFHEALSLTMDTPNATMGPLIGDSINYRRNLTMNSLSKITEQQDVGMFCQTARFTLQFDVNIQ